MVYLQSSWHILSWKARPNAVELTPWLMMAKARMCPFAAVRYPASDEMPVTVPVLAFTLPSAVVPIILFLSVPS